MDPHVQNSSTAASKNTLKSYIRLKRLRHNLLRAICYLRKLHELELAIRDGQATLIQQSAYAQHKAAAMDALDVPDEHSLLFSSGVLPVGDGATVRCCSRCGVSSDSDYTHIRTSDYIPSDCA